MSFLDRFDYELKKIVNEEIEREKVSLGNGCCNDYSDYKRRVGKLEGLAMLHYIIDEARRASFAD